MANVEQIENARRRILAIIEASMPSDEFIIHPTYSTSEVHLRTVDEEALYFTITIRRNPYPPGG